MISIAIATGIVFFLLLIGILWTLFSRRDHDGLGGPYIGGPEYEDESLHRPSSLLAHINAATRDAIIGVGMEKGDDRGVSPTTDDHDHHHPYIRAVDTPVDAAPGALHVDGGEGRPTHVRYSFEGDGQGELPVSTGQQVIVLDDQDAS